jgi:hypothetical protein
MRTRAVTSLAAGVAATVVACASRNASAQGAPELEVGAKAGVGTTPSNNPEGYPDYLGFGLGARVGLALKGIYGGGNIIYYFGGSRDISTPAGLVSQSTHTLVMGFEAGYGLAVLDLLTLRALVGIGQYTMHADSSGAGLSQSSGEVSNLYVEPGITALVTLPVRGLFVGADANILVLTGQRDQNNNSTADAALTLHGQVGYKF